MAYVPVYYSCTQYHVRYYICSSSRCTSYQYDATGSRRQATLGIPSGMYGRTAAQHWRPPCWRLRLAEERSTAQQQQQAGRW
jgi:hypothetical protein